MSKASRVARIVLALSSILAGSTPLARAQGPLGTAFTYQGRLTDGAGPANASYDMRFELFSVPGGGTAIGTILGTGGVNPVVVTAGLFTASLDFGAAFTGSKRWLEIGVKPAGFAGPYTVLAPRQELTPSPNALYAGNAGTIGGIACAVDEIPKWNGSAWACALDNDTNGGGTVTAVTASAPLSSTGGTTPDITLTGGATGDVLASPGGVPTWTGSPFLSGNLALANTSSAGVGVVTKGGSPFLHNFGATNTFIGQNAGNFAMSGSANTATGHLALQGNTTGFSNTATGTQALRNNTTGSSNTASGDSALDSNTTGSSNTATGKSALQVNTTGNNNTATGFSALRNNTTGGSNTAQGERALNFNSTGFSNTAIGATVLRDNTTGFFNTASGFGALILNISGDNNAAVGGNSLLNNTSGSSNIAIGSTTLRDNTTGSNNIAVGHLAGRNLTTGNFNIAIGNLGVAGEANTTRIGDSNQARSFVSGISGVTPLGAALPVVIDAAGQLGTDASLTAANFSGSLAGEVTGPQSATVVSNADSANTANAIVRRDAFGGFSAGSITLDPSTSTTGNIMKGGNRFIHNFGAFNTFIGQDAGNFAMSGGNNTATGYAAMRDSTTGVQNTAHGASALRDNTTGNSNSAFGVVALGSNTTGSSNAAFGFGALGGNTTGEYNTAIGDAALAFNTSGGANTAMGKNALYRNETGEGNVGIGLSALFGNVAGNYNTVVGYQALSEGDGGTLNAAFGMGALRDNSTGFGNVGIGTGALANVTTGSANIGLGWNAGDSLTTGSSNIDIGNAGVADEASTIRLGTDGTHLRTFIAGIRGTTTDVADGIAVVIDSNGQLGTISSSGRLKDDVADMADASSDLMKLRPVTFRYKSEQNPTDRPLQYGLIAEEVAAVNPGLVARKQDGSIETVFYQFLPPMLLNEYQKQQRTIQAQAVELQRQAARLVDLERSHQTLTAELVSLKTQGGRIAELEAQAARVADLLQGLAQKSSTALAQDVAPEKHR